MGEMAMIFVIGDGLVMLLGESCARAEVESSVAPNDGAQKSM